VQRGYHRWCENKAVELRLELGLEPHSCLLGKTLADHLNIEVISVRDIPDLSEKHLVHLTKNYASGFSAATVQVDGCKLILFNPSHSKARHEANVMHEIAHILREHTPIKMELVHGVFLRQQYKKTDEEEAEWLGGCLQIPRTGLEWAYRQNMLDTEILQHFQASKQMLIFRRNKTGVGKQYRKK
jgi:Zn-dependent peptidase ImmA (M78 family)